MDLGEDQPRVSNLEWNSIKHYEWIYWSIVDKMKIKPDHLEQLRDARPQLFWEILVKISNTVPSDCIFMNEAIHNGQKIQGRTGPKPLLFNMLTKKGQIAPESMHTQRTALRKLHKEICTPEAFAVWQKLHKEKRSVQWRVRYYDKKKQREEMESRAHQL